MKNSLKQMRRTPVRTLLFLILMVFAALLMTLGACIWMKGNRTMAQYEDRFLTIGTVRQIPDSFEQTLRWNAETRDYDVIKKAQYSSYYTPGDMLFPGAEYMAGPEQRAFYISYGPEYLMLYRSLNPSMISKGSLIAEFSPMEDCMPDESVQIKITKVIGGDQRMEGVVDYFCDHRNPNPEPLYKDKTYAAVLGHGLYIHGKAYEEKMKSKNEVIIGLEYIPVSLETSLCLPDGSQPEDPFRGGQQIFEVIDGFYETDAGRRLINLAQSEEVWQYCQPVTGTNKTCLLMPFYNGQAYICEGRDINEEEYASGSKVCLASKTFMKNNGLSLGDSVKVQLLLTDTRINAGRKFWLDGSINFYGGLVDTIGEPLEVFEISEYTVVGIYDVTVSGEDSIFDPGADELIVPMESIEARDGKNLMACGPMTDATSSFQIPNGGIDKFQRDWAEYGTDKLVFTFYDMGYSQLKAGIENMKKLSVCLLAAGFLKSSRPQVSEHPVTEYYRAFADNNVGQLTLQVTQKCNLDCEYCVYSENYNNRRHADKWMTFETARKAIDYLVSHCSDAETLSLGFYGGEPLLAFDLIKECTLYAEKVFEGRRFLLNFTTNGTLLTEDKVDFLVEHGFTMMISLDGPEHVQNRHRKFAKSEVGSYEQDG